MPGKYSYNVVLADYSSQGLISLPNDKQLEYLREPTEPRTIPTTSQLSRTRSQSAATRLSYQHTSSGHDIQLSRSHKSLAQANPAPRSTTPAPDGKRVLIFDSDSDGGDDEADRPPTSRSLATPTHHHTWERSQTPVAQYQQPHQTQKVDLDNGQPSHHQRDGVTSRSSERTLTSPPRRRAGGVRALIQARYDEELAKAVQAEEGSADRSRSTNPMSLHEFLDSVPRSPSKAKPQPREPVAVPKKATRPLRDGEISVKQFLDLVPEPPQEKTQRSQPALARRHSQGDLISRMPRGVAFQRPTPSPVPTGPPRREDRYYRNGRGSVSPLPRDHAVKPRTQISKPQDKSEWPQRSGQSAQMRPEAKVTLPTPSSTTTSKQAKRSIPQEKLDDYELDFDGFSEQQDSYFTTLPPVSGDKPLGPSRLQGSNAPRELRTPGISPGLDERKLSRIRDTQAPRAASGDDSATASNQRRMIPSSPGSDSLGSLSSLGVESHTTTGFSPRGGASEQKAKAPDRPNTADSWGLPSLVVSSEKGDEFGHMFNDERPDARRDDRNILIFTSDEEDEEDDDDEVDDLPTPRLQRLEEDVQMASDQWGMISAGRHVPQHAKEPDTMSELSAVYPPDIGRYASSGDVGGPLAMALQGVRHGGELGYTYKPPPKPFYRRAAKTTEILQKLGLRGGASSSGGSTISGGSGGSGSTGTNPKPRPKYHRASSARTRLPNSE
jgi:hypothetical protein